MNKKEQLEEFYNYKNWREIQRNQLNTSSNIIFTFSATIIGFTINYLLKDDNDNCEIINNLFKKSICFLLISIFCYLAMNIIKIIDYRKTAGLIRDEISFIEIGRRTKFLGKTIWTIFLLQMIAAFFGILFSFISFESIIF